MRIRNLLIIGASAALAGAGTSAMASDAAASALPVMGKSFSGGHPMGGVRPGMGGGWHGGSHMTGSQMGGVHRWGPRQNGRWHAGWRAPGGWNGYQRPVRGYVLPRYWINSGFYIANYGAYGLPAPGYGYGWSRYYDDAVMTDRYGRVRDYRSDIDWSRYDGGYDDDRYDGGRYDDEASYPRPDNGVGGAAIGAVIGGVAGNRIAGRGNRTTGTLVGAGVGAVAGYAIDKAEDAPRRGLPPPRGPRSDYDHGYDDDGVTYNGDYQGRWVGTWHGQDGTTYSGEYDGRYEGDARETSRGVDYDAPPPGDSGSHWSHASVVSQGGGYIAGGYYYPAPTVTTVTIEPATTTTTTYVTEQVSYRRPIVRHHVRRACACK